MAEIKNAYPPFRNPYKQRGRPLNYTPEELLEEFEKYVQWCLDNPIVISRTVTQTTHSEAGSSSFDRDEVENKPRLIGVGGFLVWLGETERWYSELEIREDAEKFAKVKSYIRAYCQQNQAKLASSGVFKENIISRLLGLADRQNADVKVDANVEYEVKFGE